MEQDNNIKRLSDEFTRIINTWLTKKQLTRIVERNKLDDTCCATHEFCDPNEAMDEAFKTTQRRDWVNNYDDLMLWNEAWDMSKKNKFS